MASDLRCLLLSRENAPFDEFIFSIKFCEIFQGFIKKIPGLFQGFSRDFQGFKNFQGFSRISRARTNPVLLLPRVSIRRTPLQDGQLRPVPKVSVLKRCDCISLLHLNRFGFFLAVKVVEESKKLVGCLPLILMAALFLCFNSALQHFHPWSKDRLHKYTALSFCLSAT